MTGERDSGADGQPKTSLFPLSQASTFESTGYMRGLLWLNVEIDYNHSTELEEFMVGSDRVDIRVDPSGHTTRVLNSLATSLHHVRYITKIHDSFSFSQGLQKCYSVGLTIAGDSVLNESSKMGLILPHVDRVDMSNYRRFRDELIGKSRPLDAEESLEKLAEVLEERIVKDDPSMRIPIDRMFRLKKSGVEIVPLDVRSRVGYLFGLMDAYYPLRYASEWENATGKSD